LTAASVAADTPAVITATRSGFSKSATLTVTP
jgi:hypothetical protein